MHAIKQIDPILNKTVVHVHYNKQSKKYALSVSEYMQTSEIPKVIYEQ